MTSALALKNTARRLAFVAIFASLFNSAAHAQPAAEALTEAQVKAKYQNCPNGYYSGPRPGKARYTKDKWVWAVTPEFAKNFCMPPEFVSTELKGAEAVAYKMVEDQDEERCGWGGNAEVCSKRTEHRFEVYYRNGAIPKKREVPYSQGAHLPSAMLLSTTEREWAFSTKSVKTKPRLGAIGAFDSQQFGLQSIANGKIAWPLGTLGQEIYYEEIFEGIDYLAMEGASGFSRLEGWQKSGARQLLISVRKPLSNDRRPSYEMPLGDFAWTIALPRTMADRIIANDQARGIDLKALAQRAMQPVSAARP